VGIVLASAGYPGAPTTGDPIEGIDEAERSGAIVFHAATRVSGSGWLTAGGRVLTVVARGRDVADAAEAADRAAELITWPGMQRRRDIGVGAPAPEPAQAAR
ncbi:MAG: phosphoribosylamine--glycine ligase, partial [Chloroflexi bacterium]|nr:phosphoribosylamine--glycine ligase [Chloroflexota bacterium]